MLHARRRAGAALSVGVEVREQALRRGHAAANVGHISGITPDPALGMARRAGRRGADRGFRGTQSATQGPACCGPGWAAAGSRFVARRSHARRRPDGDPPAPCVAIHFRPHVLTPRWLLKNWRRSRHPHTRRDKDAASAEALCLFRSVMCFRAVGAAGAVLQGPHAREEMPRKIGPVKLRPADGFVISRIIMMEYQTKTFFVATICKIVR